MHRAKLYVYFFSSYASSKPFNSIPGPRPLPIIGNIKVAKEISEGIAGPNYPLFKLSKKYGDICKVNIGHLPLVIVSNADAIQKVYSSEGHTPVRSSIMETNNKWIHDRNKLPYGMVFAHKNDWKRLRSATAKHAVMGNLTHSISSLSSIANSFCNHVKKERNDDKHLLDVWDAMQKWALQASAKIVFNENIDTFSESDPDVATFIKATLETVYASGSISKAPPIYKLFPTAPYKNYVQSYHNFRKLAKELITRKHHCKHLNKKETKEDAGTIGLVDQWLKEGKLTKGEVVAQSCDMMGAGIDATSSAATFLLHELAKNPEVQTAVRNEIEYVVGSENTLTAEQLQKLILLRKCVKETLRLYPLVHLMPREVAKDTVVMGYQIPTGTCCVLNWWSLTLDERYFQNPTKFDPERWSRYRGYRGPHPFASLPFGFGPRMCFGRRIAELELYTLATHVLRNFQLSTDQTSLKQAAYLILRPDEKVIIKFTDIL